MSVQKTITQAGELAGLIEEQKRDNAARHFYPESIVPRRKVLFSGLTLRQEACLLLSFRLTQKEIAKLLKISLATVKKHTRLALLNLPSDQGAHFQRLRKETKRLFV
ncbi:MAG: hypothetical protein HZC17_00065 [Candidatus Omnitrophica bacterium]|nr:hypothetical protein [Candidatus Omnitrophota bacterium]